MIVLKKRCLAGLAIAIGNRRVSDGSGISSPVCHPTRTVPKRNAPKRNAAQATPLCQCKRLSGDVARRNLSFVSGIIFRSTWWSAITYASSFARHLSGPASHLSPEPTQNPYRPMPRNHSLGRPPRSCFPRGAPWRMFSLEDVLEAVQQT